MPNVENKINIPENLKKWITEHGEQKTKKKENYVKQVNKWILEFRNNDYPNIIQRDLENKTSDYLTSTEK